MQGYHIDTIEPSGVCKSLFRQTMHRFVSRNALGFSGLGGDPAPYLIRDCEKLSPLQFYRLFAEPFTQVIDGL
jgi:hypothetical protein